MCVCVCVCVSESALTVFDPIKVPTLKASEQANMASVCMCVFACVGVCVCVRVLYLVSYV